MKLSEIVKITRVLSPDKKTPCDIVNFLESEHYSESLQKNICYGDLDLYHVLRIFLKYSRDNLESNANTTATINRLETKLSSIREITG
jgi:hypothetical protein